MVKNPIIDDRIFLNGNKLFFLEPLEATAMTCYLFWTRQIYSLIIDKDITTKIAIKKLHKFLNEVQNFISWHYVYGSKYDTPFWKQAQYDALLKFENRDDYFDIIYNLIQNENLVECISKSEEENWVDYGQWPMANFKHWYDGMNLPN